MNNKLSILGIILVIGGLVLAVLLNKVELKTPSGTTKIKVTVSFYPLEFLAQTIGGQYVTITTLTPPGAEPHDFEPSTRDIAQLTSQDIILLNGGELEEYADKIKENIDPAKTNLIFAGNPFMNDPKDPHVWLDPVLYKKEAELVAAVFAQSDPEHAKFYASNMQKLSAELDGLDGQFRRGLENCTQKEIVTSHKAFGYMAQQYGFEQIALAGFSPDEEPSSKTLADVATYAKTHKINYIFFEKLVSPAIAETVAREVGAKTLVLDPLEGMTKSDKQSGKTYFTVQKENLHNLHIALDCKNP